LPELEDALRNADAAGDTAAAQQLADEIVRMRGSGAEQQQPAPVQAAQPLPHPGQNAMPPVNQGVDAPLRVLQQGNRAIADVIGAPVDIATMGLNTVLAGADLASRPFGGSVETRIENPFMGSDWIAGLTSDLYESAGGNVVPREAVSPAVRAGGEATRFGMGALAGSSALASKAGQAAAQAPGAVARVLGPLAAPYRNSPKPMVGDAAAGAGAGIAASGYEDYAPESAKEFLGPFGPFLASLIDGVGGSSTQAATSGALDLGKNAARSIAVGSGDPMAPTNPVTGAKAFSRAEMDEAARAIQAQASNPKSAAGTMAETMAGFRQDVSPGQLPTSGVVSEDPGLVLLEREARARNPKAFLERDQATNARAGEIVRSNSPAGADPRDFTDSADAAQQAKETIAQQHLMAARSAEAQLSEAAHRDAAPIAATAGQGVAASQRLDSMLVDGSLKPMQARKNTAFATIDPDRSVVRDASPLIDAAQSIRDSLGRLNDPSSVLPTRTLDRIAGLSAASGGDGTITFGELNALRPELSAALGKARTAGDFALADNIQALQAAIHRETDLLAAETSAPGQRAADAQRIYREEFAPTWNVGPGDEATRFRRDVNVDRNARTQSPPSATAGRFLRPGQPEKAASLQRIIATLPDQSAAQKEARQFLVADLAESGAIDPARGHLRPDALRRWSNQWGASLDTVPGLKVEVDDLLAKTDAAALQSGRLANDIRAAEMKLDDTIKNKGALGLVLGKDPINAVGAVFNSGDPETAMKDILREVGTNMRAKDGLQAAVVDYVTQKTTQPAVQKTADGSRPVDFGRLENLFNRHEKTLATVFSPEQMNALRRAHKLLKPQNAIKQTGAAGSLYENKKSEHAWMMLEGGLKARYGVLKGGGILRTVRIFVSTLPNRDEAVRDIVLRMHFDPELAVHLLGRNVPVSDPVWNAKLNRLLAVAAGGRSSGDDEAE
jgi:hypothetical protein